jgi:heparosan-N-sulfate-glucuronate 5-epimerase
MSRFEYFQRVFSAYLTRKTSQLTFWHDVPEVNEFSQPGVLGEYYMPFFSKADYSGYYDDNAIPMLDYHGKLGLQYNPIAIAQYGLGNYNLYRRTGDERRKERFLKVAHWLLQHLEISSKGTRVWYHHFDFEYFRRLKAPWPSGLAQGQGLSVLVRAFAETGAQRYLEAAHQVFCSLALPVLEGGVKQTDANGYVWIEEYIVEPPTHILNGFIWALWGVYDYYLLTGEKGAKNLIDQCILTIADHLAQYDIGFWSLYELTPQFIKSIASPFYHRLHIAQLEVMYRLTEKGIFSEYAGRWRAYAQRASFRILARAGKIGFKLAYY